MKKTVYGIVVAVLGAVLGAGAMFLFGLGKPATPAPAPQAAAPAPAAKSGEGEKKAADGGAGKGAAFLDRRFGFRDGLMGGNLWFFGDSVDSALEAACRGRDAAAATPGIIQPFPGGIAASGSKAGSNYKFTIASTYAEYCPTLREKLGEQSRLPAGVNSVMEIILNGRDLPTIVAATQAAISASLETPGLIRISAGNYGGRLGKSFIYLHPDKQPVPA